MIWEPKKEVSICRKYYGENIIVEFNSGKLISGIFRRLSDGHLHREDLIDELLYTIEIYNCKMNGPHIFTSDLVKIIKVDKSKETLDKFKICYSNLCKRLNKDIVKYNIFKFLKNDFITL